MDNNLQSIERALDAIARALIGSTIGIANNKSKFRVRFTGTGTISGSAFTNIAYNAVDYDTESAYSTSTGKWTCKTAGYYKFEGWVAADTTSTSIFIPSIFKNGSEFARGTDIRVASNNKVAGVADQFYCAVGDTVEIRCFPNVLCGIDGTAVYLNRFYGYMVSQQ